MSKSTAYFAMLLLLVVIIAVLGFLIMQRKAPAEPEASAAPVITPEQAVAPETAAPAETPTETAAPVETPAPTETPVIETRPPLETETPAPEETPAPIPADASGSFRSDTGTGLNLKVTWKTFTDASGVHKLQADVSIISYSFFTSPLYQSITLTVDGRNYSSNSPEISYDGEAQIETPVASFTVEAPAPGTPIRVAWDYRGSYSGKELKEIVAAGTVSY